MKVKTGRSGVSALLHSVLGRDIPEVGPAPELTEDELARLREHPELLMMEFQEIVGEEPTKAVEMPCALVAAGQASQCVETLSFHVPRVQESQPRFVRYPIQESGGVVFDAANMYFEELTEALAHAIRRYRVQKPLQPEIEVVVINVDRVRGAKTSVELSERLIRYEVKNTGLGKRNLRNSIRSLRRKLELGKVPAVGNGLPTQAQVNERLVRRQVESILGAGRHSHKAVRKIKFESVG